MDEKQISFESGNTLTSGKREKRNEGLTDAEYTSLSKSQKRRLRTKKLKFAQRENHYKEKGNKQEESSECRLKFEEGIQEEGLIKSIGSNPEKDDSSNYLIKDEVQKQGCCGINKPKRKKEGDNKEIYSSEPLRGCFRYCDNDTPSNTYCETEGNRISVKNDGVIEKVDNLFLSGQSGTNGKRKLKNLDVDEKYSSGCKQGLKSQLISNLGICSSVVNQINVIDKGSLTITEKKDLICKHKSETHSFEKVKSSSSLEKKDCKEGSIKMSDKGKAKRGGGVNKRVVDCVDGEVLDQRPPLPLGRDVISDLEKKLGDTIEASFRKSLTLVKDDGSDSNPKGDSSKKEKSREEIAAEREAKKLAKQAKKKGKEGGSAAVGVTPTPGIQTAAAPCDDSINKTKDTEGADTSITVRPDNKLKEDDKSKAQLRAERRAKQEAQRAAKENKKIQPATLEKVKEKEETNKLKEDSSIKIVQVEIDKEKNKEKSSPSKLYRHKLFNHLAGDPLVKINQNLIHPSVIQLGAKYASRVVSGSNARCVALLHAIKQVIIDYVTPSQSDLSRGLEVELARVSSYLQSESRPPGVSMNNAVRHIKSHLTQLDNQLTDYEAKRKLCDVIDIYIREQVEVAGLAICNMVQQKISDGDVILTYGCSSLVVGALEQGHKCGKEFSVVVVDGGPWYEGRETLRKLNVLGISCTYVLISAVSFVMRKVSKVVVGAHALLSNGYVMSRVGTSMVALTASSFNVPVLVCCETHKFCERVQADAFVYNELGDPSEVGAPLNQANLTSLSLIYDITPPDLVTAVITELAILPCTSVPVVLRVKPSDVHHL